MLLSEKMRCDNNYRIIQGLLRRKNLAEPDNLKDFCYSHLWDVEFPDSVGIDSSYRRGRRILTEIPSTVLYGKVTDEIFALQYTWYDNTDRMTIYLPGIDYIREFAEVMALNLDIKPDFANKISASLSHDEYYIASRGNVYTDPVIFSNAIVRAFYPEIGMELDDVLNSKKVSIFGYNGKKYLNFDIEMPAVFLKDRVLYIYEPDSTKSNC